MGDLSTDVERCLCDCACDAERVQRAKSSCEEGRARETKRVLLSERQRLLDEMHASQRGIDAIDHMLHRVACECVPRSAHGRATDAAAEGRSARDAEAAQAPAPQGGSAASAGAADVHDGFPVAPQGAPAAWNEVRRDG